MAKVKSKDVDLIKAWTLDGKYLKNSNVLEAKKSKEGKLRFKYSPLILNKGFVDLVLDLSLVLKRRTVSFEDIMLVKQCYDLRKDKVLFKLQPSLVKSIINKKMYTDNMLKSLDDLYESKVLKDGKNYIAVSSTWKTKYKGAISSTNPSKWREINYMRDWAGILKDYSTHTGEAGDLIVLRGKQGSGKTTYGKQLAKSCSKKAIYLDNDLFYYDITGRYLSGSNEPMHKYSRDVIGNDTFRAIVSYYLLLGYAVFTSNIYRKRSTLNSNQKIAKATGSTFSVLHVNNTHSSNDTVLRLLNNHNVKDKTYINYRNKDHDNYWEEFDDLFIDYRD